MVFTKNDDLIIITAVNLQLFAEGGDGAGAAPGDAAPVGGADADTGGTVPDAGGRKRQRKADKFSNVRFGREENLDVQPQPNEPGQEPEPEETFESLRKGKYKKEADEWAHGLIRNRFGEIHAAEAKLSTLAPTLQLLAERYGIETGSDGSIDLDALNKAVTDDDAYYEDAAAERGLSVETYRQVHQLELEKKRRDEQDRRTLEERRLQEDFARLVEQGKQVQQLYPGFDLNVEMSNPAFARLTALGVDARTAYEVIHKDEILAGSMQYASQQTAQKISNAIQANSLRPQENGLGKNAPAITRITDPKTMSKEQRKYLRDYVNNGGKVVW